MLFLTVEYIKKHSRIEYNDEDDMLTIYGNAAEDLLANYLNRGKNAAELVASLTEEYGKVPDAVLQAGLMLVDVSYQHRSPITPTNVYEVPYTFDVLVKPYMIL